MSKLTIGLDVDDVLLDLIPHWIARTNFVYDRNNRFSAVKGWDLSEHTGLSMPEMLQYLDAAVYENIRPVVGASLGVEFLAHRFNLVAITSSAPGTEAAKDVAMRKFFPEIERIVHTANKAEVTEPFIHYDDGVHNFVGKTPWLPVVFSRPWNDHIEGFQRVDSWNEILRGYGMPKVYGRLLLEHEYDMRLQATRERFAGSWLSHPPTQTAEIAFVRELEVWDDWFKYELAKLQKFEGRDYGIRSIAIRPLAQ